MLARSLFTYALVSINGHLLTGSTRSSVKVLPVSHCPQSLPASQSEPVTLSLSLLSPSSLLLSQLLSVPGASARCRRQNSLADSACAFPAAAPLLPHSAGPPAASAPPDVPLTCGGVASGVAAGTNTGASKRCMPANILLSQLAPTNQQCSERGGCVRNLRQEHGVSLQCSETLPSAPWTSRVGDAEGGRAGAMQAACTVPGWRQRPSWVSSRGRRPPGPPGTPALLHPQLHSLMQLPRR